MISKQYLGLASCTFSNSIRYVSLSKLTAVRRWRNTALSQIFLHLQGFPLTHLHVQIFFAVSLKADRCILTLFYPVCEYNLYILYAAHKATFFMFLIRTGYFRGFCLSVCHVDRFKYQFIKQTKPFYFC